MPEARPIRDDIPAEELRRLARRERNGRVASRLLGLAHALEAWTGAKPLGWPGWTARRSGIG